eukprot:c12782_g1_i2.p1 GENE.c12782_g1_i2~~c12782_g1_i2.p1  ORF type:complete len:363 (+),score=69.67 c12782_g1_i2:31-1089(+)
MVKQYFCLAHSPFAAPTIHKVVISSYNPPHVAAQLKAQQDELEARLQNQLQRNETPPSSGLVVCRVCKKSVDARRLSAHNRTCLRRSRNPRFEPNDMSDVDDSSPPRTPARERPSCNMDMLRIKLAYPKALLQESREHVTVMPNGAKTPEQRPTAPVVTCTPSGPPTPQFLATAVLPASTPQPAPPPAPVLAVEPVTVSPAPAISPLPPPPSPPVLTSKQQESDLKQRSKHLVQMRVLRFEMERVRDLLELMKKRDRFKGEQLAVLGEFVQFITENAEQEGPRIGARQTLGTLDLISVVPPGRAKEFKPPEDAQPQQEEAEPEPAPPRVATPSKADGKHAYVLRQRNARGPK